MNYQKIMNFYKIVENDDNNYDKILNMNKQFNNLNSDEQNFIKKIIEEYIATKQNIIKKKQEECINIKKTIVNLKQKIDDLKQQESTMCDNNGDQQVSSLSPSLPSSSTQPLSTYNNTPSKNNPNDHIEAKFLPNRFSSKLGGGKKSRRKYKKRYKSRRRKTKKHCKSKKRRKTNQRHKKNKCH